MQILIIEDELPAARRIAKLIKEVESDAELVGPIDSVSASIDWLKNNPHPDLILLDIHLGDGSSFEIFEEMEVNCPVIFTTAYDEYAIKAFKVNSVDYLLKPVNKDDLESSVLKFKKLKDREKNDFSSFHSILKSLKTENNKFKKRFVVNYGDKIRSVEVKEVAYFMVMEKNTFLVTRSNEVFGIQYSLDQLEKYLSPSDFIRVNRKFIVGFESIVNMWSYSRSRVKLQLQPPAPEDVIVSTDRSSSFKQWLNK